LELEKNVNNYILNYNEIKFGKKIGSGASSTVFRGNWKG